MNAHPTACICFIKSDLQTKSEISRNLKINSLENEKMTSKISPVSQLVLYSHFGASVKIYRKNFPIATGDMSQFIWARARAVTLIINSRSDLYSDLYVESFSEARSQYLRLKLRR